MFVRVSVAKSPSLDTTRNRRIIVLLTDLHANRYKLEVHFPYEQKTYAVRTRLRPPGRFLSLGNCQFSTFSFTLRSSRRLELGRPRRGSAKEKGATNTTHAVVMEKKNIDYGNLSDVRRVRYYRSPDPDRPLDDGNWSPTSRCSPGFQGRYNSQDRQVALLLLPATSS